MKSAAPQPSRRSGHTSGPGLARVRHGERHRPRPSWRASPPRSVMATVAARVRHGDRRRPGPSWQASPPRSVMATVAARVRRGKRRRPGPSWRASPPRSVVATVATRVCTALHRADTSAVRGRTPPFDGHRISLTSRPGPALSTSPPPARLIMELAATAAAVLAANSMINGARPQPGGRGARSLAGTDGAGRGQANMRRAAATRAALSGAGEPSGST
jgi:hypothetical protein